MKNQPLEIVRRFFNKIESDIVEKVRNNLKQRSDTVSQNQLVKKVLRDYLINNKQNDENSQQINGARQISKQRYDDQSEKLQKMKNKMDLEFQLTRKFIKQYSKNNNTHNPMAESNFLYSPRNIQIKPLGISTDFGAKVQTNNIQNSKALNKLKKLQKFVYKNQRTGCLTTRNITTQYSFSPSKDEYKQDNKRLKIELNSLKYQLESVQNSTDTKLKEQLKQKQQRILKKQQSLSVLQIQLTTKQQQLIKKQTDSLIRSKLLQRY